jgi:hypothetical protein
MTWTERGFGKDMQMTTTPISEHLRMRLVRQGIENGRAGYTGRQRIAARSVGTGAAMKGAGDQSEATDRLLTAAWQGDAVAPMGNERAGRSRNGAARQSDAGDFREENESRLADEPSPARQSRPVLRVVNAKDGRTHVHERLPLLGVRPSLVLVWSN